MVKRIRHVSLGKGSFWRTGWLFLNIWADSQGKEGLHLFSRQNLSQWAEVTEMQIWVQKKSKKKMNWATLWSSKFSVTKNIPEVDWYSSECLWVGNLDRIRGCNFFSSSGNFSFKWSSSKIIKQIKAKLL